MSEIAEGMIGIYSSGRVFSGNLCIKLSLSIKDMDLLEEKFDDPSNWIELKIKAFAASEAKQGTITCWLMKMETYQGALRASGYAGRGLSPVNVFRPSKKMVSDFFKK